MNSVIHPNSQECEAAFYRAFEAADLAAMMAVWAEDDDIVCVHPGGPRLAGIEAVRESWREIFAGGPGLRVRLSDLLITSTLQTAIHTVHEHLSVPGDSRPHVPIVATNVYLRTQRGWRIQLHHASPVPAGRQRSAGASAPGAPGDPGLPPILH
jgi:uncharacterized protein (TIGR02246 family)